MNNRKDVITIIKVAVYLSQLRPSDLTVAFG